MAPSQTRTSPTLQHEQSSVETFVDRLLELSDQHLNALRLIVKLTTGPKLREEWVTAIDATSDGGRISFRSPHFSLDASLSELKEPFEDLARLGLVSLDTEDSNGALRMTLGKKRFSVAATALGVDIIENQIIESAFSVRESIQRCISQFSETSPNKKSRKEA